MKLIQEMLIIQFKTNNTYNTFRSQMLFLTNLCGCETYTLREIHELLLKNNMLRRIFGHYQNSIHKQVIQEISSCTSEWDMELSQDKAWYQAVVLVIVLNLQFPLSVEIHRSVSAKPDHDLPSCYRNTECYIFICTAC